MWPHAKHVARGLTVARSPAHGAKLTTSDDADDEDDDGDGD